MRGSGGNLEGVQRGSRGGHEGVQRGSLGGPEGICTFSTKVSRNRLERARASQSSVAALLPLLDRLRWIPNCLRPPLLTDSNPPPDCLRPLLLPLPPSLQVRVEDLSAAPEAAGFEREATFIYNNWLSKTAAPYQISAELSPVDGDAIAPLAEVNNK
eukprot:450783-Prorocentrum_minimum.AAC.1